MTDVPDWLADWLHTVTLWDIALWGAGITALVLFFAKGWPAFKQFASRLTAFIRTVDAVVGLPDFIRRTDHTLAEQNARIGEIHHEVHYNNGSSVKDAAHRIEEGVAGLYERVDGVDVSLAGVHGRLDDLDRRVHELGDSDVEIRQEAEDLRRDFEDTHPHPRKRDR